MQGPLAKPQRCRPAATAKAAPSGSVQPAPILNSGKQTARSRFGRCAFTRAQGVSISHAAAGTMRSSSRWCSSASYSNGPGRRQQGLQGCPEQTGASPRAHAGYSSQDALGERSGRSGPGRAHQGCSSRLTPVLGVFSRDRGVGDRKPCRVSGGHAAQRFDSRDVAT